MSETRASPQDIIHCYRLLLNRDPRPAELESFREQVTRGCSRETLVRAFLDSSEFQEMLVSRHGWVKVTCRFFGIKFDIATLQADVDVGQWLREKGFYEPYVTNYFCRFVKPGAVVADIGANIGYFSLIAAALMGSSGRVISVEPNPSNINSLLRSLQWNGLKNVMVYPCAASTDFGVLELHTHGATSNGFVGESDGSNPASTLVPSINLDRAVGASLPTLDVIKIDVEGFELSALGGFEDTIRKFQPTLFTEYHPIEIEKRLGKEAPEAYLEWLLDHYPIMCVIARDGHLLRARTTADVIRLWQSEGEGVHVDIVCMTPKGAEAAGLRLEQNWPPISKVTAEQPGALDARLEVVLDQPSVVGELDRITGRATGANTGSTAWYTLGGTTGEVRFACRLFDVHGVCRDEYYWRSDLPVPGPFYPGENFEFFFEMPCPPPGHYILEFGLVAEGVSWFEARPRMPFHVGFASAIGLSDRVDQLGAKIEVVRFAEKVKKAKPLPVTLRVTNTGKALWLPSDVPIGGVRAACRLRDWFGRPIESFLWRAELPFDEPLGPGKTVEVKATIPCPPPGRYRFEFDLVAEGVSWFGCAGSATASVRVDIQRKPITALSVQAKGLAAKLGVTLEGEATHPRTAGSSLPPFASAPVKALLVAENIGAAQWLPSFYAEGGVNAGCKLLDWFGRPVDLDYWRGPLPTENLVEPGDKIRIEAELPPLERGHYMLEFDLVAEGVAWFGTIGSKPVRLPFDVDCPPVQSLSDRKAGLAAEIDAIVTPGSKSTLLADIRVRNTGTAHWLPGTEPVGGVRIAARLFDHFDRPTDLNFWRAPLSETSLIDPGEMVEIAAEIPTPPPGHYLLEFDVVAEGICWFSEAGSACPRVTLAVDRVPIQRLSDQGEGLAGELTVTAAAHTVAAGAELVASVTVRNTGTTHWLPSDAPRGPVRVGCRLCSEAGESVDPDFARYAIPGQDLVDPGERREFFVRMRYPGPGRYILEFDLVADGVAWLRTNGGALVHLPLEVTPPPGAAFSSG